MSTTDEHDGVSVLNAIDQLRRELSSYHGQLKAYNDLKAHSEQQRKQLACLQAATEPRNRELKHYKRETSRLVAENEKLRDMCSELLHIAEAHDPEWMHWPELRDELQELGVE